MNPELLRCCDLVMRGGVTSGVLYPAAIREIADKFYLVGIGGTSAGAIASCAAAAAEYRRRHKETISGFEDLQAVSNDFSRPGRLMSLFRPDEDTRKLFAIAMKVKSKKIGKLGYLGLYLRRKKLARLFVKNGYGICTGMANGNRVGSEPPLTEWLADLIDRLADKEDDSPLTFRDLHTAPIPSAIRHVMESEDVRSIDLRAVTTCLTFARPFEFPLRLGDQKIFAFDPSEWSLLFPKRIVDYLVVKAKEIDSPTLNRDGKCALPILDLPIVVAARMSLSFPGLFSMVPLWSVNFHDEKKPLKRVWFSDGGITSNFPMHRFDSIYPCWPTMGINLHYTDDSGQPQRKSLRKSKQMVYLPSRSSTVDLWSNIGSASDPIERIMQFGMGIFSSAQQWHDNSYLKLPGYRDRSVEIWLTPDEGGLNLGMSQTVIQDLVARGAKAGREIATRFSAPSPTTWMDWPGHRWTRFRSGMAGLTVELQDLASCLQRDMKGDTSVFDFLNGTAPCPDRYKATKQQLADMLTALTHLQTFLNALSAMNPKSVAERPFGNGPKPMVEIGSRPPF